MSDDLPLITFIIPTINRPSLRRSIDSLINQTFGNWRCILVFDGVEKTDFYDWRITSISIPKTGLFGSKHGQSGLVRNEGLKMAKTQWIGFLDDDDTLDKRYVETLFNKYFNYDVILWRMRYKNGSVAPPKGNSKLEYGKVGISFCYKNKFENLMFECNRDGEDFDFLLKLQSLTKSFIVSPEVFYFVRH